MYSLTLRLRAFVLSSLLLLTLLGGCASTNPRDPIEPVNRAIYTFNDGVDNLLLKPAAEGYRALLPQFVRTGVSNFFANINDILIALNNLLQGKFLNAASDIGRVLVNSTVGVLGVMDFATDFGLEKHNEDFGQTLGYWGVGDGPYLVLPFFGPSNLRDAVGRFVDYKTDPVTYVDPTRDRNILWGTRVVSQRSELLETSKILETAALDPYEFVRDAYLQRRRNLVHDGSPPPEKDDDQDIKVKPRTELSPFPVSAQEGTGQSWNSWDNRANNWTPAREEAMEREREERERAAKQAAPAAPRAEAPQQQPTSVVRLWLQ